MSEEISEQAKASTIALILHALNMDPISKYDVARYVQYAIDEATAEKDKEIERLDAEIARLKNLLNRAEDYMGHAPICCFKPPDGDRCDCGLWEVKRQINEAIDAPATTQQD